MVNGQEDDSDRSLAHWENKTPEDLLLSLMDPDQEVLRDGGQYAPPAIVMREGFDE